MKGTSFCCTKREGGKGTTCLFDSAEGEESRFRDLEDSRDGGGGCKGRGVCCSSVRLVPG